MPPRESDPLIVTKQFSVDERDERDEDEVVDDSNKQSSSSPKSCNTSAAAAGVVCLVVMAVVVAVAFLVTIISSKKWTGAGGGGSSTSSFSSLRRATGPYRLLQRQVGEKFLEHYDFYDGADSIGSAGYQTYVGEARAKELNLVNVTREENTGQDFVYMQSAANDTQQGAFRASVRLEGKRRFNRGLFILDVAHMPSGCGVWPAFWMTDEANWPNHGEIDIVEGINTQSVVKTALHTSEDCSMFAHVPAWAKTGVWDTSTGLPDTYTGQPNYLNRIEADNCWVMAPHQWANQGCVAVSTDNGTIGEPMNKIGGGVYVLEWDPVNGYIKSWVFKNGQVPQNLQDAMATSNDDPKAADQVVIPEPESWTAPYAYFAIGEGSGCSNDHFQDMRLVFNLAFCGTVAGNRFFRDCPATAQQFNVSNDSVLTCNAFIASEPESLAEAYWKIRGVYVYEREYERQSSKNKTSTSSTSTNKD